MKNGSPQYAQTPKQALGEVSEKDLEWEPLPVSFFHELINQINFQIVRTKTPEGVVQKYKEALIMLKKAVEIEKSEEYVDLIAILIKMCAYTRDIVNGMGEWVFSYHMVLAIGEVFPKIGRHVFKSFVDLEIDGKPVHPYGSWKDVKYISDLQRKKCLANRITTVEVDGKAVKTIPGRFDIKSLSFLIKLINDQLTKDHEAYVKGEPISLLAKWIPREGSIYGWLYEPLACDYFKYSSTENKKKAENLCKMEYRKLISKLNKHLDTTQVKQCAEKWSEINPEKVTSVTLFRNKKAFLNVKGETGNYQ